MNEDIVIAIFVGVEGVHAYSAFLPSVFTIKTFVKTEEGRDMIREGETMATLYLAAMVGVTSAVTRSVWPLVFGLIAGAVMIAVYEYALYRAPVNTGALTDDDMTPLPKPTMHYYRMERG